MSLDAPHVPEGKLEGILVPLVIKLSLLFDYKMGLSSIIQNNVNSKVFQDWICNHR